MEKRASGDLGSTELEVELFGHPEKRDPSQSIELSC